MIVSVAMCTCNGEKYLEEQLESIALQSRLPDELIILDDCSTDGTQNILKNFTSEAKISVNYFVNDKRLGVVKNFEKAISFCKGDIIVLSDQDDIWELEKIKNLVSVFEQNDEIGLVFSDAELVDQYSYPIKTRLWTRLGFDDKKQYLFEKGRGLELLLKKNVITGATLAFRRKYCNLILPIPDLWMHDHWIACVTSFMSKVVFLKTPLIKYRLHNAQQIGARKTSFTVKTKRTISCNQINYLNEAETLQILKNRLEPHAKTGKQIKYLNWMDIKLKHLLYRVSLPRFIPVRIWKIGLELVRGRYHSFSNGTLSALKDLRLPPEN